MPEISGVPASTQSEIRVSVELVMPSEQLKLYLIGSVLLPKELLM